MPIISIKVIDPIACTGIDAIILVETAFFLEPDAKVVDFPSASKGKRIQTEGEIPILSKTAAFLIILYQSFNTFLTHRIDIFRIFAS